MVFVFENFDNVYPRERAIHVTHSFVLKCNSLLRSHDKGCEKLTYASQKRHVRVHHAVLPCHIKKMLVAQKTINGEGKKGCLVFASTKTQHLLEATLRSKSKNKKKVTFL